MPGMHTFWLNNWGDGVASSFQESYDKVYFLQSVKEFQEENAIYLSRITFCIYSLVSEHGLQINVIPSWCKFMHNLTIIAVLLVTSSEMNRCVAQYMWDKYVDEYMKYKEIRCLPLRMVNVCKFF